jgi:hypothetical protein
MVDEKYRGYIIGYSQKPIPTRAMDYDFYHEDVDGAPDSGDNRYGNGPSVEDCKAQIDEQIEEELPLVVVEYLHGCKESTADTLQRAGFEEDTPEFENAFSRVHGALYEVTFHINVDTGKILAVNGKVLTEDEFDGTPFGLAKE